jgi:hypothetical protein
VLELLQLLINTTGVHLQAQAFLRGPTQQEQITGFTGVEQARRFVSEYFQRGYLFKQGSRYSATAKVSTCCSQTEHWLITSQLMFAAE